MGLYVLCELSHNSGFCFKFQTAPDLPSVPETPEDKEKRVDFQPSEEHQQHGVEFKGIRQDFIREGMLNVVVEAIRTVIPARMLDPVILSGNLKL